MFLIHGRIQTERIILFSEVPRFAFLARQFVSLLLVLLHQLVLLVARDDTAQLDAGLTQLALLIVLVQSVLVFDDPSLVILGGGSVGQNSLNPRSKLRSVPCGAKYWWLHIV